MKQNLFKVTEKILKTAKISLALFLFGFAIAANAVSLPSGSEYPFATSWTAPATDAVLAYDTPLVFEGTYQIPAGWVMNMYAVVDGVKIDSSKYPVDNIGQSTTQTGTFMMNAGIFPPGAHTVNIVVDAAEECALITVSTCVRTDATYRPQQTYYAKNLTISLPNYPVLEVTPSSDPAIDIANLAIGDGGANSIRTFTVKNIGGVTVPSGGVFTDAPFTCSTVTTSCNLAALAPGDSKQVTIKLSATTVGSYSATVRFTCGSTCTTVYRNVKGNVIANPVPPKIFIDPTSLTFPTTYIGTTTRRSFTIKNIGGGILSGSLTFDPGFTEFTCFPDCNYSLFASAQKIITVKFTPILANLGDRSNTAHLSGGDVPVDVPINAFATNDPAVYVWDPYPWNAGTINVGNSSAPRKFEVRNSGAGLLSGTVQFNMDDPAFNVPGVFKCTDSTGTVTMPNCDYNNIPPNGSVDLYIVFSPLTAAHATSVTGNLKFTNTTVPSNFREVAFSGQGNNSAIGTLSVSGGILDLGIFLQNTVVTRTIDVTNTGVGMLNGSFTFVNTGTTYDNGPGGNGDYNMACISSTIGTCDNFSIPAGSTATLTFTYTAYKSPMPTYYNFDIELGGNAIIAGQNLYIYGNIQDPSFDFVTDGWDASQPFDFGKVAYVAPNFGVTPMTFVAKNTGNEYSSLDYQIIDTPHFKCISDCGRSNSFLSPFLGTRERKPVIQFQPSGTGAVTEAMQIKYWRYTYPWPYLSSGIYVPDTDGIEYVKNVTLTAEAGIFAAWNISGVPLTFNNIPVSVADTQQFSFQNSGAVDLDISLNTSGPFTCADALFGTYTTTCNFTITPSSIPTTIYVKFLSTSAGTFDTQLPLQISEAGTTTPTVRMLDVAANAQVMPVIQVTPTTADFGEVNIGAYQFKKFTVKNVGAGVLANGTVSIGNTSFVCVDVLTGIEAQVCNLPMINAGNSVDIEIRFRPKNTVTYTINAVFSGNQLGVDPVDAILTGKGKFGVFTDFGSLDTDFGNVKVNKSSLVKTLPIKNLGSGILGKGLITIGSSLPDGAPPQFQCIASTAGMDVVTGLCKYDLGSYGQTDIQVVFIPRSRGFKTGTVTFSGVPGATFDLRGTGVVTNVNFKEQ